MYNIYREFTYIRNKILLTKRNRTTRRQSYLIYKYQEYQNKSLLAKKNSSSLMSFSKSYLIKTCNKQFRPNTCYLHSHLWPLLFSRPNPFYRQIVVESLNYFTNYRPITPSWLLGKKQACGIQSHTTRQWSMLSLSNWLNLLLIVWLGAPTITTPFRLKTGLLTPAPSTISQQTSKTYHSINCIMYLTAWKLSTT